MEKLQIIEKLQENEFGVRSSVIGVFSKGDAEALIELTSHESEDVRLGAIDALADIKDRRGVPALVEALKSENHWQQLSAAYALGEIGDRRGVPALTEALKSPSGDVWESAMKALVKMMIVNLDSEAAKAVGQLIASDNVHVRNAVIDAIRQ